MKRIVTALALTAALSLTACGVSEGTVTNVEKKDAWSEEVEITTEECETEWDSRKKKMDTDCEEVGTGEFETVTHEAEYTITFENEKGDEGSDVVTESEGGADIEVGDFYKED